MPGTVDKRLTDLGISIPNAASPVGNYMGWVTTGNLVFVSGQIPFVDSELTYRGRVGDGVSLEDAQKAARVCALNLVAQVKAACGGDLDRVTRVVKITGYVNSVHYFTRQAEVLNAASDLMVEVFGADGKHARAAVSCPTLPLGASVEIDGVFEIRS